MVYAVAGYQETNGLHAYALDAATGKVKWESHDAGSGGPWGPKAGLGLYGNLAIGAGRLWLASGTFYPGSFSLTDGSWIAAPCELDHHFYGLSMRRGADISVIDQRYIITGGMRLSSRQDPTEAMIKGDGYNALSVQAPDVPKAYKDKSFYGVDMLNSSDVTPAWDDALFVGGQGRDGKLRAWDRRGLLAELDAQFALGMDPNDRSRYQVRSLNTTNRNTPSSPANALWSQEEFNVQDQVLCADAVLAVHATYKPHSRPRETTGWYLSALDRKDGSERWRIDLPSKPMRGGLSVDRDGRIFVAFDDGSLGCYGR